MARQLMVHVTGDDGGYVSVQKCLGSVCPHCERGGTSFGIMETRCPDCAHDCSRHDPEDGSCEVGSFPPCACGPSTLRARRAVAALTYYETLT
jgi:hypothetical protein